MSGCSVQCGSCVGEALSVSGSAFLAAVHCKFEASECNGHGEEGAAESTSIGILSQYSPVVAESCSFVSSGSGSALEGVRLQGSSHMFSACDWLRCPVGAVLTDEASAQFLGCSWTLCDVGLQAVSKSKAAADQCVLVRNSSAAVLEEGAHALFESSQFLSNRVAVATRSASLHLQSSCCVFDAVALIFDKRSTAALADSSFFGVSGGAAAASGDDVEWLRGGSLRLSAAAVATAVECIEHARQVQQAWHDEGGTAALQVACAIKSVSSVKWCAPPGPLRASSHAVAAGARVRCATPARRLLWRTRRRPQA